MRLKNFEHRVMELQIPDLRIIEFRIHGGHVVRCIARSDTFVVVWLWRGNAYVHYPDAAVLALADDELSDHINNRYRDNDIMTAAETDGVDWWRERRYDITK